MKIASTFITMLLITVAGHSYAIELEDVRNNYDQAVKNKQLCKEMITFLSHKTEHNTFLGYLGAFQTIWANHTINPAAKLSTFQKGKRNIEKAINTDPENVELRFIRLSIQLNCPFFLGYHQNIEEDRLFIRNNLDTITSDALGKMCRKVIN